MRGGPATRFRELIRDRLIPGLHALGFEPLPGTLVAAASDGVFWMLDLDIASWSNPKRVTFGVSWGVYVPGINAAMGEIDPVHPSVDTCAVQGRLGQRDDKLDPTWFELKAKPWPMSTVADAAVAKQVLMRIEAEVVPVFELLGNPAAVQDHLFEHLETSRGIPDEVELLTIARIAAISVLRGERENAARWLDHLAVRSEGAMSPEVVAEKLAPLRQHLIAS
jgi:hypothetical protein